MNASTPQSEAARIAAQEALQQQEDANARAVIDGADDPIGEVGERPAPREAPLPDEDGEPSARRKPIYMSPADEARRNIAKRFRHAGEEGDVPFNGDLTDSEMLYGQAGRKEEPEVDPNAPEPGVPRQGAEPEPAKTRTVIIRGKEVTLTEDEILERAMKVSAADSYLEEARTLLDEAKSIRGERSLADQSQRQGDDQTRASDDGQELDPPDAQRRPAERTRKVIEEIQFGDPEKAAEQLDQIIDERADKKAENRQIERLMQQDLAVSQKALKDFMGKHPELNDDPNAAILIEKNMYDLFREEIEALGTVDKAQIPKDAKQLADWHRFHRIHNDGVSKVSDLLEKARTRVEGWRGGRGQQPKPTKEAITEQRPAPRVNVDVDRTQRRAALPNQPTRTVVPRPDAAAQAQPRSRSDVVSQMRKSRGQLTA